MIAHKPRPVPPPTDAGRGHAYARFIPREELNSFAAWAFGDLSAGGAGHAAKAAAPAEPEPAPVPPAELLQQQLKAARQSGYQDGYRDGGVALEGFKQSFAAQTTMQVGQLLAAIGDELAGLQQEMAKSLAATATALARRIVRSELAQRPECVAAVAAEAVDALLLSARHIVVRLHPDDHRLVADGAAETLAARGARLLADASITRGGCRVDSDIGGVDATVEERWKRAAASLGQTVAWDDDAAPVGATTP